MKHLFLAFALTSGLLAGAQPKDPAKTAAIKTLIESRNYMFKAVTAVPLRGGARHLTSEYDITVSPASLTCDLPYFGRAYTADFGAGAGQSPMSFTAKNYDYTMTPQKKGGWNVTIKPKDVNTGVQQMALSIGQDGYATVQVISSNRDAITYNGSILPAK
jgi:hypothetical protein